MTTLIPPELESFVQQQLASGEYRSAEEVIGAGLRVLQELKHRQEDFRKEVQIGVDQLDRSEGILLDQAGLRKLFDEIQQRGQSRHNAGRSDA
ncbi:MAG: type II toxin-antitoxin system ParD family antitoxin [Thermoguttaceae bacterium]|jgi:putative addiction module CopG family antidote